MPEKRKYVRMSTVFPVEIQLYDATGEKSSKNLLQGFTRDIGQGGMCVELKSFGKKIEDCLNLPEAKVTLYINASFLQKPVQAFGRIAWLKKEDDQPAPRYLIGVAYIQIEEKARKSIYKYARRLQWMPRTAVFAVCILAALLLFNATLNMSLIEANKKLVLQLLKSAERKSTVLTEVIDLQERKKALEKKLSNAGLRISKLEKSLKSLSAANASQREAFESELTQSIQSQNSLKEELKNIREGQIKLDESVQDIKKSEQTASDSALKSMYEWIRSHQNVRTGLVASFEGDPSLEDWAFTYDQSLACQTFLLFGDVKPAESILAFYEKKGPGEDGIYYSSYHAGDGDPAENDTKVGPNVWLGIAALQYEAKTKDGRFLPIAERIGDWLIRFQDSEGGLRGGPKYKWYSTEHNLDAYAYFKMMYEVTKDEKYKNARDKSLAWIKKYAYSNKERRLNRGKGDATISTDTFSWAIAALGPETLREIKFDTEGIMEFAEKNCAVAVDFTDANGKKANARGFDFAKAEHVGRGGVLSTEWTAQMIVTYRILSRYFQSGPKAEKAKFYHQKAEFYLSQLQKLIITSPSRTGQGRGCLPYASLDNVDTGHGWRTPKGKRTGSVSATAYGIFAWMGYNPFELPADGRGQE